LETIRLETWIAAPIERCFDAARDLDLHVKSMAHTNEQPVGGRTSGLIELGEEVTWRARHFGVVQHFTSRITAFHSFVHDHYFESDGDRTKMSEVLVFSAPLGFLGRIAEKLVLRRYLTQLLTRRAEVIRTHVEGREARA
jgi:hypothetical protein